MSRQIDWEQPLSDKDRAWARQFSKLHPLIESNDLEHKATDDGSLAGEELDATQEPYEGWTVAELQQECKDRGLPANGKLADLKARLVEHDEQAKAQA